MRRAGSSKQGVDDAAAQQQLAPSLSEPIEPTPENVLAGLEVQGEVSPRASQVPLHETLPTAGESSRCPTTALSWSFPPRALVLTLLSPVVSRFAGGGGGPQVQTSRRSERGGRGCRPSDPAIKSCGRRASAASPPSSPLPVSASSGSPRVTCTAFSFAVRRGWLAPVSWRIFLSACASAERPPRGPPPGCLSSPTRSEMATP